MTHPSPRDMLEGWTSDVWARLHPVFAEALAPAIIAAQAVGLRVHPRSSWRSNTEQRNRYEDFLRLKAEYEAGKIKVPPLPAAPPGASAHNFAVCPTDPTHVIGASERCPKCGSPPKAASLAEDVMILDRDGNPVPSGGALSVPLRPAVWQSWATLLTDFPQLRDGGTFSPRPDSVHVESVRWDHRAKTLRAA